MRKKHGAESGEDRLIARYFKPLAKHPGAFGLVDDAAAIVPPADCDLVLTADGIVGGVHFFPDDPPDTVARKALRVNLSDVAAKGARPLGFSADPGAAEGNRGCVAGAVRARPRRRRGYVRSPAVWRRYRSNAGTGHRFNRGFRRRAARQDGAPGRAPSRATGWSSPARSATRRSACCYAAMGRPPGGGGLVPAKKQHLVGRYLVPEPRTAIAAILGEYASAAMDVSDGLAGDLAKFCRASGVAAEIEVARIPLSVGARAAVAAARADRNDHHRR